MRLGNNIRNHAQLSAVTQGQHHQTPYMLPTNDAAKYVMPGWFAESHTTGGQDANRLFGTPVYVSGTQTFDRMSIEVTTAAGAGSECRLGVYEATIGSNGRLIPGALKLDAGKVATDATAIVEATVTLTLTQGYWFLVHGNGAQFHGRGLSESAVASVPLTIGMSAIAGDSRWVSRANHSAGDDPFPATYPESIAQELGRFSLVWLRVANL